VMSILFLCVLSKKSFRDRFALDEPSAQLNQLSHDFVKANSQTSIRIE
jgi:hypothetical protein